MNLIHKTKTWLLDNNILVPDDWVTACIEWIQEEHQVPYVFGYKTEFFPFQTNPKNLDPSYKMELDLGDCLGRVELVL